MTAKHHHAIPPYSSTSPIESTTPNGAGTGITSASGCSTSAFGHQVMLGAVLDHDHPVGSRDADRVATHRHPAVQRDDGQVHHQARRHECCAGHPSVHGHHREEQHVAGHERCRRQPRTLGAADRDRHRLQHQRDRRESPPVHADALEEPKRAAGEDTGEHREPRGRARRWPCDGSLFVGSGILAHATHGSPDERLARLRSRRRPIQWLA